MHADAKNNLQKKYTEFLTDLFLRAVKLSDDMHLYFTRFMSLNKILIK